MKSSLLLFFNYFILFKIVEAGLGPNRLGTLNTATLTEGSKAILSTPASNLPLSFDRKAPKCYPETAKAYFLPAPPLAPIVTILDTNSMDIASNFRSTFSELSPNPPISSEFSNFRSSFSEISSNSPVSSDFSNFRSSYKEISSSPPVSPKFTLNQAVLTPTPIQVLPDLIDEVPLLIQDRFSRLAESEDVGKVCDTCALVAKLPIYNFDQELLNGFLAGLGL